jgi:uncharacterized protein YndB with AHSA1/START domain
VAKLKVKQYMHGTNLTTDWKVGSAITWQGDWKGRSYVDKGNVLELEPEKRLKYTHWRPMGGSADEPENYHAVTCEPMLEGLKKTASTDRGPVARSSRAVDHMGDGRATGRAPLGTG